MTTRVPIASVAAVLWMAVVPGAHAQAPAAGQVRGAITTARKTPAVGAVVVVRREDSPSPVWLATTGTTGRFGFDGLTDGTYRAEVRREGYAPVVKSGIAVKAPFRAVVEVVLARGSDGPPADAKLSDGRGTVALRVRTAAGTALPEAQVRLTLPGGGDDPRTGTTNGEGAASFPDLAAGTWRLEVLGAGLLPLRAWIAVAGDVSVEATLAAQPADYRPAARDLIVPEDVTPPPGG